MSEPVLEVENLVKDFGKFRAVDRVSFSVPKGKIIGLLGPNGAGKTTTIHMLLGVTSKSAGSIKFFGKEFSKNYQHILGRINYASSFNTLQGRISVKENLEVFAMLYGMKNPRKKIEELTKFFEIDELLNTKFWNLSAGQKTRVILAKALLNDPEVLLMDEPTASLDPDISDKLLSLIEKLNKERGLSILYTSHDMDEVTRVCDEVIFLDKGKIVAQDSPLGMTKRIPTVHLRVTFDAERKFVDGYLLAHKIPHQFESGIVVLMKTKEELVPKILYGMQKAGVEITDIDINKPTLEDVFLEIARGGDHVLA